MRLGAGFGVWKRLWGRVSAVGEGGAPPPPPLQAIPWPRGTAKRTGAVPRAAPPPSLRRALHTPVLDPRGVGVAVGVGLRLPDSVCAALAVAEREGVRE